MSDPGCPECGAALPQRSPGGLCPVCMASALSEDLFGMEEDGPQVMSEVPGFLLEEVLGEGGAGIVWKALEMEPPHREVALKVLKSDSPNGEAAVRFEAEMAALAMMDHPGIARVFHSGTTLDGQPFFAMERIKGPPINQHEVDLKTKLILFQQVCDAVGHAHRRGVIHRDLKPSNVLIGIEDDLTQAKVIDFGIAKATDSLLTDKTLLTRAHQFLGTPAYMSPEQAEMKAEGVDTRSDIYSLGIILFELLTGKTPIACEALADLPYDEILRRIRTQDPPRPSSLVESIDKDLDWIVLKALAKNPAHRYETADALSRDIQRFQEGRAIVARPPSTSYRIRKFVKRNRGKVAMVTGVLLSLIVGSIVSTVLYFRAEAHRERAELSERRGQVVFSRADFTQATAMQESGRPALAVAHLVRSVRTNPENHAAARKLLFTLAAEKWARPVTILPHRGWMRFLGGKNLLASVSDFHADRDGSHYHLYVHDLASREVKHRFPITEPGNCIALSSNQRFLAVGGWYGAIWVWDLETGEQVRHMSRFGKGVSALEFSPDGSRLLASFWHSNVLKIWQCSSWELERSIAYGAKERRGFFALSPDGEEVVFGVGNHSGVFRTSTGQDLGVTLSHEDEISAVFHLGDGCALTCSRDGSAKVWEIGTGVELLKFSHENAISAASVSLDKRRLLTGTDPGYDSEDAFVRLWDLKSGELICAPIAHPGRVHSVLFSEDGSRAASACKITALGEGAVRVWDSETGKAVSAPIYQPRGGRGLALSPDGTRVAVSSRYHESSVWDIAENSLRPLVLEHGYAVWRAVFEQGGRSLLTLGFDGRARKWNAHSGQPLSLVMRTGPLAVAAYAGAEDPLRHGIAHRRFTQARAWGRRWQRFFPGPPFRDSQTNCFAVSKSGEWMVTGGKDGVVRVWSIRDGSLKHAVSQGKEPVMEVALGVTGKRLVSGARDGSVSLWDLPSGQLVAHENLEHGAITSLSISSEESVIAVGSQRDVVCLWWPERDSSFSQPLAGHGYVNHLSFSPDGSRLAAAGTSNAVLLWDAKTGDSLGPPMRHIDTSTYGLFPLWLPDGQRLVSTASHDNTARLWNASSGSMLSKPMQHPAAANAAALSPNGETLLFADGGKTARIWDLESGEPLTPLLDLGHRPLGCAFDERGERFACCTMGGQVHVWDLPASEEPLPSWFLDYAEALGGFRFNENGVLEQVPVFELAQTRERVIHELKNTVKGSSHHWMRWLASDPANRPPSPLQYEHLGKKLQRWGRELIN